MKTVQVHTITGLIKYFLKKSKVFVYKIPLNHFLFWISTYLHLNKKFRKEFRFKR